MPSIGRRLPLISKPLFRSAPRIENATYNWDIGTIQRPNANERQFEVASHRWIDLSDKTGTFGTTILTDFKNGSDKPNDNTLRLTLMRSPGIEPTANGRKSGYTDQANQDWGHHEFVFGLTGHAGRLARCANGLAGLSAERSSDRLSNSEARGRFSATAFLSFI